MTRVAVLDLGTNTFHLLIAEIQGQTFKKIYHERSYTKLGAQGTHKIGDRPYSRGIKAIQHFAQIISNHQVDHVRAIGTSALRQASNGSQFIQEVADKFQIPIEVIDGLQEADYIYKGVMQAIPLQSAPYLIMDIGGGSVEFIIGDHTGIIYKESFKVGLSVLHAVADISDTAEASDVITLHQWLAGQLSHLYNAIARYQPQTLIGSAGAFEVLASMSNLSLEENPFIELDREKVAALYVQILGSSRTEKLAMPGLPKERVDYISAAFVLIWHVLDSVQPKSILVSKFALKEGVLAQFLD